MAETFSVEMDNQDGVIILKLSGEIDLNSSPQLRNKLSESVGNNRSNVVLDLSGVPYMDSSGVGTLVEAKRMVEKNKAQLFLVNPQTRVFSVLEITHLHRFFTICDTLEEALKA